MNESIRDAVRQYAAEILNEALMDGDASETAESILAGIKEGWKLALADLDAPQEFRDEFSL
jgi:hypothetical protein